MSARFELFKDTGGDFRFRLKAANGEIIAASQGYTSKAAAQNGIASVKANAASAPVEDLTSKKS
ncbi:YegP family protein [Rhodococcus sp. NPDC003382]|uniref:YegP family protein n=1 Tax=unclassified Rhodococcus (in: high G+C Gram-positive bacteria) TaxID=192944 RepID=UPI0018CDAEB3|nr:MULTISPECIES: YegP family protein [unclassified Rhodococcus (in: high G+C Gram-positive bacteria)]MBH0123206.1 YegP family protein [Rhodococcus sp. CX]MCK8671741.1 YegP family protein [Rhodococcus sp. HM1]